MITCVLSPFSFSCVSFELSFFVSVFLPYCLMISYVIFITLVYNFCLSFCHSFIMPICLSAFLHFCLSAFLYCFFLSFSSFFTRDAVKMQSGKGPKRGRTKLRLSFFFVFRICVHGPPVATLRAAPTSGHREPCYLRLKTLRPANFAGGSATRDRERGGGSEDGK